MANKKAFQAPPPAAQVRPQPRPLPPPPFPDPDPEPALAPKEVYYPSSDGKPMADNSWQADRIHAQYGMLHTRYVNDPDTFVAMALLLYYTEGEPADVAAPDVFVARGVPNQHRDWYKVWEEGKAPDFALEVSSEQTAEDNLGRNMETYARIGISEYCVYDPTGGLHFPRLQMFRLSAGGTGVYERVKLSEGSDGSLAVPCESLGLELRFEDDRLRLWDPAAQEYLLEWAEERAARLKEEDRLRKEEDRLRKEEDRLRKERDGHMEERAARVAAEQRVRELELKLADLKERVQGHR